MVLKYVRVIRGDLVDTAEYLGEAEDIFKAMEKFKDYINVGDMLVEFENEVPWVTDEYGYETVDMEKKTMHFTLIEIDDTVEDLPEGIRCWE